MPRIVGDETSLPLTKDFQIPSLPSLPNSLPPITTVVQESSEPLNIHIQNDNVTTETTADDPSAGGLSSFLNQNIPNSIQLPETLKDE